MNKSPAAVLSAFFRMPSAFFAVALLILVAADAVQGPATAQGLIGVLSSTSEEVTDGGPENDVTSEKAADLAEDESRSIQSTDEYIEQALRARDVLKTIVASLPVYHEQALTTLREAGGERGLAWLPRALISIVISIALGLVAMRFLSEWGRKKFAGLYREDVYYRSDKLIYLYLRALLMMAGLVLFAGVMVVAYLILGDGLPASNQTAFVALNCSLLYLFIRIVFFNLLVPDSSVHRLVSLSDEEAYSLYRSLITGALVSLIIVSTCIWMDRLGLPQDAHKLSLIIGSVVSTVILSGIAFSYRKVVARLILGTCGDSTPFWQRGLAAVWHYLAVLYFFVALAISAYRVLLDLPSASGLVGAPLQALLLGAVVYGLLVLIIDRLLLPRLDTAQARARIAERIQKAEENQPGDPDAESVEAQAQAEATEREGYRAPFRDLLDHGASILVLFGSIDVLARLWGVNLAASGSVIGSFYQVLLIIFVGYMAFHSVKILIDQQIAKEAPAEQDEEAEVGGAGESRIATLLPLFRNFLLITIVSISAMVVLSELGVNIGPLFAGAGVVGLAVGFGAQTLIRDIFSGAFYLIDDAFRKGEYIDIGSAKGVVEKISIRSMQLRHHMGALTTVPFGEIQQVENYSRDWAVMKLAFRVTYDTDVEKMRKLIKNFGKELLQDEYYGPMFLAPLKSQGILSMEDSAMIARVKFTTKPGKQFELRKIVYAGLRDLFDENGIKFAHKQVTVRVAGTGDGDEHQHKTPDATKAVAAAGAAATGWEDDGFNGDGGSAGEHL